VDREKPTDCLMRDVRTDKLIPVYPPYNCVVRGYKKIKLTKEHLKQLQIDNVIIHSEDCVKLLGVDIDFLLNFDKQVTRMCKKAANQLNLLLRI
jgi:hypothetical protein